MFRNRQFRNRESLNTLAAGILLRRVFSLGNGLRVRGNSARCAIFGFGGVFFGRCRSFHRFSFHRFSFHRFACRGVALHRLTLHRLTLHRCAFRRIAFRGRNALAQYLLHLAEIQSRQCGSRVRGLQRRQLIQGAQAQVIKELPRRAKQRGTSRGIAMANDLDPPTVLERLDDLRRHGHPADVFDVAPRHGLAPRHDGERFHHGARVFGRFFGTQTLKVALHARAALKTPTRRQLHQLQAAVGPVAL
ncbi:hypothetical protein D3C85_492300 [compost metagenome]